MLAAALYISAAAAAVFNARYCSTTVRPETAKTALVFTRGKKKYPNRIKGRTRQVECAATKYQLVVVAADGIGCYYYEFSLCESVSSSMNTT